MNRRNVSHNFYIVAIALSVPLMVVIPVRAQTAKSPVGGTTTGGASTTAGAGVASVSPTSKPGSASVSPASKTVSSDLPPASKPVSAGVSPASKTGSAGLPPAFKTGSAGLPPASKTGSAGVSPASTAATTADLPTSLETADAKAATPAVTTTGTPSTPAAAGATLSTPGAPRKKIIFKPGVELSIGTSNETIKVTNDAKLAKAQVDNNADSPEAHFVYAVALTRTSQVEEALKEIRVARKLSGQKGGAAYFDSMISEYEEMLKNYPEDNQIRYHLAWAYYMKAYVLARYSKQVAPKPPVVAVGNATPAGAAPNAAGATPAGAAPLVASANQQKNWQSEFVAQNSMLKPEELVEADQPSNKGTVEKTSPGAEDAVASKNSTDSKASKKLKVDKHTKDIKVSEETPAKDYVNLGEEPAPVKPETPKASFTPPTVPPANAASHSGNKNFWANPLGNLPNLGPITGMEYATANAAPEVIPQVKAYYRRALKKLDEVIEREPDDMFASLYRAHLKAEYSGDIDSAMNVWESCRAAHPNSPAPYFFLGEGYLKKGNLGQCLTNVSKAIALRSTGN